MADSQQPTREEHQSSGWILGSVALVAVVGLAFWQWSGIDGGGAPVYAVRIDELPISESAIIEKTTFYSTDDEIPEQERLVREVAYRTDQRLSRTMGAYVVWAHDQGLQSRDHPDSPGRTELLQEEMVVMIIQASEEIIEGDGTSEAERLGVAVRPVVETTVTVTVPSVAPDER